MVSPGYLITVAMMLVGVGMGAIGHAIAGFSYLDIFGPVVFGLGVGVGMVSGGVGDPRVYAIVIPVVIGLMIAISYYNVYNLGSYGL